MAAPAFLLALFFGSGFAGLVYELLWVRVLALLFGNTAQATATTLAVFFLGLSLGQRVAGRRAGSLRRPLRAYAMLEALIAVIASAYFVVTPLYRTLLPALFARLGSSGPALTAVRAGLGAAALLPMCLCMGATLPVMGQLAVRRLDELTPSFGLLYAVQTVGGAFGAFAAGFWLPGVIGFTRTYLLAMSLSVLIAALAFVSSGELAGPAENAPTSAPERRRARAQASDSVPGLATSIACLSGFTALAVEVLWTHMFTQALHNSVYSFAAILVTFLIAIGFGGLLAGRLARLTPNRPLVPLIGLLVLAGIAVAVSPFLFNWLTDGLHLYASREGWQGYVRATFGCAAAVMLVPGILLGSVFPYTVRLANRRERGSGAIIGELAFWNTGGAVAGSLWAGFVSLPWLGLWQSLHVAALLYLLGAAAAAAITPATRRLLLLPAVGFLLLLTALDPARLPLVSLDPGETLKSVQESASGTVAVTEAAGVIFLKLDDHYTVGASGAVYDDRRQAELPMLLHPRPRSVFFLGLGTGITAGGALSHPVEQITVAELVPGVVDAARGYFAPYANGLFTDTRAHIVVGDGRTLLQADPQRYDVIVGDLFVPWQAGTGSLYTREHFETVRDHLTEHGIFAQWLPLYQMSWRELAVVARTMLEVFPLVTVWRGDFSADNPAVALIGHRTPEPLNLENVVANVRRRQGGAGYSETRAHALTLLFYAGNLTMARNLVTGQPINTDDQPVIEYLAPATPMEVVHGQAEWLTGKRLSRLWVDLASAAPPDNDPYLAGVPADERGAVEAGRMLHDTAILHAAGNETEAHRAFGEFARRVPADVAAAFAPPDESR